MWRWIIRVYASIVLFWFFMFCLGLVFVQLAHALMRIGWPYLLLQIHSHLLVTMFLLGLISGSITLGSNFTGAGWFRSRDGQSYEGFKFEEIKPWTWLLGVFIFGLGVVLWRLEQVETSALLQPSVSSFYHDFLMPDCSNVRFANYRSDMAITCTMHLLFVGIFVASVGYSLAPMLRKIGAGIIRKANSDQEKTKQAEQGTNC
jgi:hypothetical protein